MKISPELRPIMIRVLQKVMKHITYDERVSSISPVSNLFTYFDTTNDEQEKQAARALWNLIDEVRRFGHNSEESVSEFMDIVNELNDPKMQFPLLKIAVESFDDGQKKYLKEWEEKLLTELGHSPYASFTDKVSVMQSLFDDDIMESILADIRENARKAFAEPNEYKREQQLKWAVKDLARSLRDNVLSNNRFAKQYSALHAEDIKELMNYDSLYEKYGKNNDKISEQSEIVQEVIPGTEKYAETSHVNSEQPEPQKQPEPQQATIIELQQEQEIANLKKQIAELTKQNKELAQKNQNLEEINAKNIDKVKQFQQVSEGLQHDLEQKSKENQQLKEQNDSITAKKQSGLFQRLFNAKKDNENG